MPDGVRVIVDSLDAVAERRAYRLTGFEPIHACEVAAGKGDVSLGVDYHDGLEPVALADFEVEWIVRWGHLHGARAELGVYAFVGHDRNLAVHQRQHHGLADHAGISLVAGVHGNPGVTEHRLGPGRRNGDRSGSVRQRIGDIGQLARVVLVFDFDVGQRRMAARTPVDDAVGTVDEALVVEVHEDLADGIAETFVEREALPRPVGGVAEAPHLLRDRVAGLGLPHPDLFDEGLAADVVTRQAFFAELTLDHVLGGDACVVRAGEPQGGVPLHAFATGDRVLDRQVEGVAHVEDTGDVRGRDDDAVRLAVRVDLRLEGSRRLPHLVPARFDLVRLIRRVHRVLVSSSTCV